VQRDGIIPEGERFDRIWERQNYGKTPQEKQARQKVHENACAVMANIHVLQEELKGHYNVSFFDKKEAERVENRIKYYKRKALEGKVSLSKED